MNNFITRVVNRGRKRGIPDSRIKKLLLETGAVSQTTKWERPTPDFTEDEIEAAKKLATDTELCIPSWEYLLYGDTTVLDKLNDEVHMGFRSEYWGGDLP